MACRHCKLADLVLGMLQAMSANRVVLQNMAARTPHLMHHLGEKAKDSLPAVLPRLVRSCI